MSKFLRRVAISTFLVLCGGALVRNTYAAAPAAIASREDKGIRVSIMLDKTDIVVGEPIYFSLLVENISQGEHRSSFSARPFFTEGNDFELMIAPQGELPQRYEGTEARSLYNSVDLEVRINHSYQKDFPIIYDQKQPAGYMFHRPGTYTVSAKIKYQMLRIFEDIELRLPETKITVREPQGRAAAAFKLIDNPGAAKILQSLVPGDLSALAKIRQLAAEYPDTPYAPLCLLASGVADYRMQNPQYEHSISELKRFLSLYPTNLRAPEAALTVAFVCQQNQQPELARAWYFFVTDVFPNYPLVQQESPMTLMYVGDPSANLTGQPWWLFEKPWTTRANAKTPAANAQTSMEVVPQSEQ